MAMLPLSTDDAVLLVAALDAAADKTETLAVNGEPGRAGERLQLAGRMRELRDRVHRTVVVQNAAVATAVHERVPPAAVDTFPVCAEGDGMERCTHGPNGHPGCWEAVPA